MAVTEAVVAGDGLLEEDFLPPDKAWSPGRGRQQVSSMPSYPPVEALQRGMEILRCVNSRHIATISEIHAATGFPKPTIVRMLETFIADGYVVRDKMCGGYRTTSKTGQLHSGSRGIAGVIEAARPWAIDLTERLHWPVGIGSLSGPQVSVHFSTAAISPWTHTFALGMRLDLFYTAMGRAYLAFCDVDEREMLLSKHTGPGRALPTEVEQQRFRRVLAQVQDAGFALRGHRQNDRTSSVALPIRQGDQLLAVINLSYYRSVVSPDTVKDTLVAPLREAVRKIEETVRHMEAIEKSQHDA